jgi:hypothetical protein
MGLSMSALSVLDMLVMKSDLYLKPVVQLAYLQRLATLCCYLSSHDLVFVFFSVS